MNIKLLYILKKFALIFFVSIETSNLNKKILFNTLSKFNLSIFFINSKKFYFNIKNNSIFNVLKGISTGSFYLITSNNSIDLPFQFKFLNEISTLFKNLNILLLGFKWNYILYTSLEFNTLTTNNTLNQSINLKLTVLHKILIYLTIFIKFYKNKIYFNKINLNYLDYHYDYN